MVCAGTALPLYGGITSKQKYSVGVAADLWFDSYPEDGDKTFLRNVVTCLLSRRVV
jgi:hypothetical protein